EWGGGGGRGGEGPPRGGAAQGGGAISAMMRERGWDTTGLGGRRGAKEEQPMPLRDHFRPPLDDLRHWEGFHATWPVMIVALLRRKLPRRYFAEPRVQLRGCAAIDVTTFEDEGEGDFAPPRPNLVVGTDLPAQDVYEV